MPRCLCAGGVKGPRLDVTTNHPAVDIKTRPSDRVDFEGTGSPDPRYPQDNGPNTNTQSQSRWDHSTSSDGTAGLHGAFGEYHDLNALLALDEVSLAPPNHDGHLVDVYYTYFHPAHPILPPLHTLNRCGTTPPYLEVVLKFIGSHFTPDIDSGVYRPLVDAALRNAPNTLHKVQAYLLFSIALHSRHERGEASESAAKAVILARELGMHHSTYTRFLEARNSMEGEIVRRTWWELYVVDGLFAAFDGKSALDTDILDDDMPLPSDELAYADCRPDPLPPTAAEFFSRAYADDEREFSSFCQRIDATRILRRVLSLNRVGEANSADGVDLIDANISSWFFLLPDSKTDIIRGDGSVDEMMFQAYMIIHCASIFLHFPRSNLLSPSVAAAEILCAERGNITLPSSVNNSHAPKTIKAADEISVLASLRPSNHWHTPFFICALAVSAIAQLSKCSTDSTGRGDPQLDKITLTISLLKSLNRTWAVSQQVLRQIRAVAKGILERNGRRPPTPRSEENGLDLQSIVNDDWWLGNIQDIQFPM
ncbi:hypothetical protein FQN54_009722 [Arachnomyces sp. PD_36]|nr:hypothetical protein FQN54_009722 [Arachnomyces sp. PD_36]